MDEVDGVVEDAPGDGRPSELDSNALGTEYRLLYGLMVLVGCLAIAGWVWAACLVLVPVSEPTGSSDVPCGVPAVFNESAFADSLTPDGDADDERFEEYWGGKCANRVDWHVRGAVAVSVVTAPLAALWIWSAGALRFRRAAAQTRTTP